LTSLAISEAGVAVKYKVYLRENAIELQFTNRGRVELAARLLRLAGVSVEVQKAEMGGRDRWYIEVSTDMLAAGREELRKALAEIVRESIARGWVEAGKAERWLEKLEGGVTLIEGWPRYEVGLVEGALVVRFSSTDRNSIQREAQRLKAMGLEEGIHFSVKMPEEGREGYVSILREGLKRAAWLSKYGSGRQRELAARCGVHTPEGEGGGRRRVRKSQKDHRGGKGEGLFEAEGLREGSRSGRQKIQGEGHRRRSR
jgi:Fe2+ transport system protein FeoA